MTVGGKRPRFNFRTPYTCYLLQSCSSENRTYFGYSKNVQKRLRQHNGEIAGGAKYTSRYRPWRLICTIVGFPNKRTALQFEWRNHHPPTRRSGVPGRIKTLSEIMALPRWTQTSISSSLLTLTCTWFVPDFQPNEMKSTV